MQPRLASPYRSAAAPAIALSRTPAANDTDTATQQTVRKMCELIRQSCADDVVQRCASYARKHFACSSSDPAMLVWGVWWYVKHCVKFRLDEGTMMMVGETNQQDLLIAPEVLVRMKDPSEDCDGFTMLTGALLTLLGVEVLIATVAVDQDDPTRWSHVFLCGIVNGRVIPLDTSHGKAPGWMVPRSRINRWQTWTLDGRPANVPIPANHGLHGYVQYPGLGQVQRRRAKVIAIPRRGRGFGQICTCDDGSTPDVNNDCVDGTPALCDGSGVYGEAASNNPFSFLGEASPTEIAASTSDSQSIAAAYGMCADPSTGGLTACPSGSSPGSTVSVACPTGYYFDGTSCVINPSSPPKTCVLSGTAASGTYNCPTGTPQTVSPNWGALASQIVSTAGVDARAAIQQPQNLLAAQTWANLVNYLPMIGIAVLGVIVLTTVAGKK